MILVRPRPIVAVFASIFVLCTLYLLHPGHALTRFSLGADVAGTASASSADSGDSKPYGRDYKGHAEPEDINRVSNSTLGFGRVFVVGLPERTDKRDALALSSSLTGFDVEWIDGVRGESIPNKAVPFGIDRKLLMETNLGSWRGHMNAIRKIVEENIDSALIMEDDMDWDVRLKPQLELIAAGTRAVMGALPDIYFPTGRTSTTSTSSFSSSSSPQPPSPNSPYGDDWDILWLGHCGEPFPEDLPENKDLAGDEPGKEAMARKWAIMNDVTVPPFDHLTGIANFGAYPERTRWVHPTAAPICTFAYAVSLRGARKILYDLSVDRLSGPFDNALAGICRRAVGSWAGLGRGEDPEALGDRGFDAKCLSVTPPLFFHHKAKGLVNADSDIQEYGGGGGGEDEGEQVTEMREKGQTENIMWSARLNIANMISGREMQSQW